MRARLKVLSFEREKIRRGVVDGPRKLIEVDNHESVNVGGLRQGTKSVQVVKPRFTADFPEAVIRARKN